MDTTISISVIIPVYNREDKILHCLESVKNQTVQPSEIIVIDDGSTDDTIKVVRNFDKNIIIAANKGNLGAQSARNLGIKKAKYDWIAFLDSDDEWLPNKLKIQLDALTAAGNDLFTVIHGDCYIKNEDKGTQVHWKLEPIVGENVYKKLLSQSGTLFPSILTSKLALEKINYLDENVLSFQEWETSISLSQFCRFIHINEPLFIYNQSNIERISNNSSNSYIGYNYIVDKHEIEIREICDKDTFEKHKMKVSTYAMNNGDFVFGYNILKNINSFSMKYILLKICSYIRIKPKYIYLLISYFKGKNDI